MFGNDRCFPPPSGENTADPPPDVDVVAAAAKYGWDLQCRPARGALQGGGRMGPTEIACLSMAYFLFFCYDMLQCVVLKWNRFFKVLSLTLLVEIDRFQLLERPPTSALSLRFFEPLRNQANDLYFACPGILLICYFSSNRYALLSCATVLTSKFTSILYLNDFDFMVFVMVSFCYDTVSDGDLAFCLPPVGVGCWCVMDCDFFGGGG